MYDAIVERVKKRLKHFHIDSSTQSIVFDHTDENPFIEECVKTNVDWLRTKFNKAFTADELENFETIYESVLTELTLFDCVIEGAEYQTSHSENGINRSFKSKDEIFNYYGYYSYVKILC